MIQNDFKIVTGIVYLTEQYMQLMFYTGWLKKQAATYK